MVVITGFLFLENNDLLHPLFVLSGKRQLLWHPCYQISIFEKNHDAGDDPF